MGEDYDQMRVGIAVFVFRDGKILMGKRKGIGEGTWALPGGHLETGESILNAARRELEEETGLEVDDLLFRGVVNDPRKEEHYIHIVLRADGVQGEPIVKEPDKCSEWQWYALDGLPENIFSSHGKLIELAVSGDMFSDG